MSVQGELEGRRRRRIKIVRTLAEHIELDFERLLQAIGPPQDVLSIALENLRYRKKLVEEWCGYNPLDRTSSRKSYNLAQRYFQHERKNNADLFYARSAEGNRRVRKEKWHAQRKPSDRRTDKII
jgi:hypothetical protein